MGGDIVKAFMQQLLELHPQTAARDVLRVERRLRRDWGGATAYVQKDALPEDKALRLAANLAAGVPLAEAMEQAGCSRAGGYRLLSRKWRVR